MANLTPKHDFPNVFFFTLAFLLAIPFYILNALAYLNLVAGPKMGALYIALFTITPVASASFLTFRTNGLSGLKQLLGRVRDFNRIASRRWCIVALVVGPLLYLLSLAGLSLANVPLPPALVPLLGLPAVFVFFFLLAACEELGWMGYAFEPMQQECGAQRAALVLGTFWAFWHLPFFIFLMPSASILISQVFTLIGTRVLIAWVYNNTGKSVFAAILFHAADNTALVALPQFNTITPWFAAVHCGLVLVATAIVTFIWDSQTLAQYRHTS